MSGFMGGGGPMESERIALSQRERDLRRVLHEVRTIPGGNFNMAERRTFLLCVDSGGFSSHPKSYPPVNGQTAIEKVDGWGFKATSLGRRKFPGQMGS